MSQVAFYSFVEDALSKKVAERLVAHVNATRDKDFVFLPGYPNISMGFGAIRKKFPSLIKMASKGIPVFVITDLDTGKCASLLLKEWADFKNTTNFNLPSRLVVRIAVREVESWLLADRSAISRYFGIARVNFPRNPDDLKDPKQDLLNIVQRKGRKKWHRLMLPQKKTDSIGPEYNKRLCEFVGKHWNPEIASANSPSLAKAIRALELF